MCKPGKRPDGPIISRASPGRKHPYWTGLLSKFPGVSCPEWSLTPGRLAAAFNPPLPTRNDFKNSPGVFILSSVRKRGEPPPPRGSPLWKSGSLGVKRLPALGEKSSQVGRATQPRGPALFWDGGHAPPCPPPTGHEGCGEALSISGRMGKDPAAEVQPFWLKRGWGTERTAPHLTEGKRPREVD